MTIKKINEILYDICDREHASCNSDCPVYKLNGCASLGADKPFKENRGCDCFKNGKEMKKFIEKRLGRNLTLKDFTAVITYYSNF